MTRQYPDYKLELVNKESKPRYQGAVQRILRSPSNVTETSEMSSEKIKECLDGVEEAVERQVQRNDFEGNKEVHESSPGEKSVEVNLPDAKIVVEASVFDARKDKEEYNPKALPEHAKSEVKKAGPQGEPVPNSGIEINYRFESDSGNYEELYEDVARGLIQLKDELDLSEGTFFGKNPPNYKSVMS